ncbi:MAG TPA: GerMN domain-containing protein [Thermoanaerobaculia bacterium]|jgi:hypothetical protein
MSRRAAAFALGVAVAILIGGLAVWLLGGHGRRGRRLGPRLVETGVDRVSLLADLYFPGDGSSLKPERRELAVTRSPKDQVRKVVEALLAGPTAPGLARPLPKEVALGSVLLGSDGVAYVDLQWANHDQPPAAGSDAELQMVYSVVDSIALNVPQAPRVVLLWNGAQRQTFCGHLDTSRPLEPMRELLR